MNEYPLFNKRLQKSRTNYTFGSRNLQRAEEWFAERKKVMESPVTSTHSPANSAPSVPSVPPGFSIREQKTQQTQQQTQQQTPKSECNVCFRVPSIPTSLECCKKSACFSCTEEYISVNNRCPSCRKVVNATLYDLYDGCDVVVPPYDEFQYLFLKLEPITPLNHLLPVY